MVGPQVWADDVCGALLQQAYCNGQTVLVIAEGGGVGPELVVELDLEVKVVLWVAFEGVL